MKTSTKQQRNRKSTASQTKSLPFPSFPRCYKESSKPHKFCPGCGHPITLHEIGMVVDELGIQNKTAFLIDIGCSLLAWDFFDIDTTQTHHGRTVPTAVGFKRAMPDATVIAYLGDGGGYAIGTQHLVHATLRNDPITVIIINNLTYAMTGGQMAPTTIEKQPPTTTAPFDRTPDVFGTNLKGPELVLHLAMPGAFVARTAVDNPLHVRMTIKEALLHQQKNKAFSFVEVLSFCPTNWKTNAQETFAWMGAFKETYPLFKTITGTNS